MGLVFGKSWQEPEDESSDDLSVSYWFRSKKDPRFKGEGRTASIGGVHAIVTAKIETLEKCLGTAAPDDIQYGGIKD
jgi:hypothetical protein